MLIVKLLFLVILGNLKKKRFVECIKFVKIEKNNLFRKLDFLCLVICVFIGSVFF